MEKYRADKNHAIRRYHKTYKEYVKYQESTSQLNEQLEAAKDQLKKVQEQNDANEQLMEERRVRLDQLSSENETLLKKLESQTKALEEQKSQEDDKLQKLKDEHARDLRKLDTNFAVEASKAAQAWKNQSLQKLAELNGVVKHLKDEVTEKDRLLLTSNTQVEKQKIEMREVLQTVEELKLANSQIKVERQQLEDERNETVQQYDVVKGQLEDRAKRIADLEREMASLQSINSNWNHWYQQFIAPAVANPPPPFSSSNSTFGTPLTPDTTSVDNVSVNPPLMKITKTD
ncbi:hypothetical protein M3Y94_00843400 [Aphelenchoides besseyi]|nr:hypothetical protein M3Y94_00843400 [Aphelenchoides besseyi]